jgi:hypothetical protein
MRRPPRHAITCRHLRNRIPGQDFQRRVIALLDHDQLQQQQRGSEASVSSIKRNSTCRASLCLVVSRFLLKLALEDQGAAAGGAVPPITLAANTTRPGTPAYRSAPGAAAGAARLHTHEGR